jgi:hypothetical protein
VGPGGRGAGGRLQRVAHLAFLAAYPVRAILIMIASALVIWTVLNHGDAARV